MIDAASPGARAPLHRLFEPRSIAVVGASASPDKPGWHMVNMLAGFGGEVWPVNPRETEILGRKAYPSLADIPGPVDLVALLVPPKASVQVLREAVEIGAGAALMVSGGFGETGADGKRLQDEIVAICRDGGLRLLGPNTSGFMAPETGAFCTFMPGIRDIAAGDIAVAAQSGGINITLALIAHRAGLGLRFAIGLGNAADVGLAEVIDYLAEDEGTRAIAVHLEGVPDGRRLFEAIRRATRQKPVVALPVGRADLGGFAESHTGNLMGSFALTRAALVQAGAVVADGLAELVDAAHALSCVRLPPKACPGIGVMTGQAGPGLLMTDELRHAGIAVPEFDDATVARIAGLLPPMTYTRNPVDTGRPGESFAQVLDAVASDAGIDAMLVWALLEEDLVNPAALGRDVLRNHGKPVVFGTSGTPDRVAPTLANLRAARIPAYQEPDRAARAVRALVDDSRATWRRGRDGERTVPAGGSESPLTGVPDEHDAKELIAAAGIATPRRVVCASRDDARAALDTMDGPVAVKILDPAITHKTELGGVHLGIDTPDGLNAALDAIDSIEGGAVARRYLIEEMAPPGLEIIIGGTNDPGWGPTILLGLGGTAAEALGDVSPRLAPLGWTEAAAMIEDLAGKALFDGWRGAKAPDRKAVCAALVAIGDLMCRHPEIRELDLNPVRVYPDGVMALDALVVI